MPGGIGGTAGRRPLVSRAGQPLRRQRGAHRLADRRHHARARAPGEHLSGAAERHRLSRPRAGRLLLARAGRAHPLPERHACRMDRHRPRRVRAGRVAHPRLRHRRGAFRHPGGQPGQGRIGERSTSTSCAPTGRGFRCGSSIACRSAPDGTVGASRTLVLDMRPGDDREAGRIAEMRFARFFNNTPMAIASVDREGRIALTNARFVMLFGKKGASGQLLSGAGAGIGPRRAWRPRSARRCRGRARFPPSTPALADDIERSIRFFVSPILEGEAREDAAVVYALETTEQRALELQFAQSQKMQAVGQLAGGIAHDFNNMLTAIIGFSDLLLTNHRPTDPSFQDIMNIKQNANRAAGLVRQLLAFSRRQTLRPKVIDLDEALSDISVLLAPLARRDDQARGRSRPRRLADQGGLEPARAGDREPRGQCARRHAGRRNALDPHRQRDRPPRAKNSGSRVSSRASTCCSKSPTPAPA